MVVASSIDDIIHFYPEGEFDVGGLDAEDKRRLLELGSVNSTKHIPSDGSSESLFSNAYFNYKKIKDKVLKRDSEEDTQSIDRNYGKNWYCAKACKLKH